MTSFRPTQKYTILTKISGGKKQYMTLEVGTVVTGKIAGITNFGAFVELEDGKNCLIHISEISDGYVKDVADFFKVGDSVKAVVIGIDDKGKVSLSVKQLMQKKTASSVSAPPPEFHKSGKDNLDFEEMMHSFKQASDEKLLTLKRVADGKRGAGKRRK